MDNKEDILRALEEFEEKSVPTDPVPEILEKYVRQVAKTGETIFEWDKMKGLFLHKLNSSMLEFFEKYPTDHLVPSPNVENVKFEEMKNRILDAAAKFTGAPFTIQRLCELITDPQNHYQRTDKLLRGLEKNLNVVSAVDPFGYKIVSDPKPLYNGMDSNGMELRTPEKVSSPFLPPAPTNSPTASLFGGVTATCSPSPLLQSWPREGSGEALADIGSSNEAGVSMLRSNMHATTWDSEFDGYLPPEKKLRLDSTTTSLADSGKVNIPEPMPSVSEVFAMHKLTTGSLSSEPSMSVNHGCQFGVTSVIKDRTNVQSSSEHVSSDSTSLLPSFVSTTSCSSAVTSSEPSHQVTARVSQSSDPIQSSTDPEVPSQSSSDKGTKVSVDSQADSSDGAQSSDDHLQQSESDIDGVPLCEEAAYSHISSPPDVARDSIQNSEADQTDASSIDGVPLAEAVDDDMEAAQSGISERSDVAEQSGIDDSEEACEETSSECEPREQIASQPIEDGVDRRDSQGFDVSPNPEETLDSPQSEPDTTPSMEERTSPVPDPEVSSSSELIPAVDTTASVSEVTSDCEQSDGAHDQPTTNVIVPDTKAADSPKPESQPIATSSQDTDSRTSPPNSPKIQSALSSNEELSSMDECQSSEPSTVIGDEHKAMDASESLISQSTDPSPSQDTAHPVMDTD